MKITTDIKHIDRLREKRIIIEDVFLKKDKKLIRMSDSTRLDKIENASRIEKRYYHDNKCIYREKRFDKNSSYTFATYNKNDKINCSNCGNIGLISDLYESCPYCGTYFNIDYGINNNYIKNLKEVLKSNNFRIAIVILSFLLILILNIIIHNNIINSLLLFLLLPIMVLIIYIICSLLIITETTIKLIVKFYYDEIVINKKNSEKRKILSCLNYELNNYYYNIVDYNNLIDFDIIRYYYIKKKIIDNTLYSEIKYKIRKYYLQNDKIIKKVNKEKVMLKYNELKDKIDNLNYNKNKQSNRKTVMLPVNDWYIDKIYEYYRFFN